MKATRTRAKRARDVAALAAFARAPVPGKAKTRLIPLLGARRAAEFQRDLIHDALAKAGRLTGVCNYLFVSGNLRDLKLDKTGLTATFKLQRGSDLGQRLARAFAWLLRRHPVAVVIGTDSPLLPLRVLRRALRELRRSDAVLGPCPDGGYYLIGLRASPGIKPKLGLVFRGVRWSTSFAFRDTRANLSKLGLECAVLPLEADVDRPADFRRLCRTMQRSRPARRLAPTTWRFVKRQKSDTGDNREETTGRTAHLSIPY